MVINELENELKNTIKRDGINSKIAYQICKMLSIKNDEKYNKTALQNYYIESIIALIEYIKLNEVNPSEKRWNKYAIENRYLSGKSIGYMYEDGFNNLCRKIRKMVNKKIFLYK